MLWTYAIRMCIYVWLCVCVCEKTKFSQQYPRLNTTQCEIEQCSFLRCFFFVSPRYSFVSPPSTDKWMSTPALFTLRDRNLSALLAKTSQNRRKIGVYGSPCRQIEVMNGIEMPLVGIRSNVDIEHSYVLHGQTILFTCAS